MNDDKLVIRALLDSMIMNQRKGASVSLSEESDSFKFHLNFLFEKEAICIFFTGPMLQHPTRSPTWEGNEPRGKPIRFGWDGDTIPVYSY